MKLIEKKYLFLSLDFWVKCGAGFIEVKMTWQLYYKP